MIPDGLEPAVRVGRARGPQVRLQRAQHLVGHLELGGVGEGRLVHARFEDAAEVGYVGGADRARQSEVAYAKQRGFPVWLAVAVAEDAVLAKLLITVGGGRDRFVARSGHRRKRPRGEQREAGEGKQQAAGKTAEHGCE